MHLLGLTGLKQSGKDTVFKILEKQLAPKKVVRVAFADALKKEVAKGCGVSLEFLEKNKDNFRLILQGWGTDFRRKLLGEDYWLKIVAKQILALSDDVELVVVTDVRFHNEAELIKKSGGSIWRVVRNVSSPIDQHSSEQELLSIYEDKTIFNHNSLVNLEHEVTLAYQYTYGSHKKI